MSRQHPTRDVIRRLVTVALTGAAIGAVQAAPAFAAPSVAILKPTGGIVMNERNPKFSGTAEELAGVVTLNVYAGMTTEGVGPVRTESTAVFSEGDGRWSIGPLTLGKPLEDGVYTATASQTNMALEKGTSAPVTFTIFSGPPTVTLDQPHPAPGESAPSFGGTASDTKPVTIQIHAGESEEGTVVAVAAAAGTGAGWRSSPAYPTLAVGRYTAVAIQESSLIGNPTGRSDALSFDVLPSPPATVHASPAAGVAAQLVAAPPRGPALMAPFPVVRVGGVTLEGGMRLRLLSVQQAPVGAVVRVRCRGGGCPAHRVRRITVAGSHPPPLVFHSFERYLHAGAVIEVFVTKDGVLGKYTRLRVRRGKLPERTDLCLNAAGVTPIACPAA